MKYFNENNEINEGLIDVIFKTLRTNLKVNVSGPLIYFKLEFMNSKTFFTVKIRKKTFTEILDWMNSLVKDFE